MPDLYTQGKISESPFPNSRFDELDFNSRQKHKKGIYEPITIPDQPFPYKTIANEIVGSSINTISGQVYKPMNFSISPTISGEGLWPCEECPTYCTERIFWYVPQSISLFWDAPGYLSNEEENGYFQKVALSIRLTEKRQLSRVLMYFNRHTMYIVPEGPYSGLPYQLNCNIYSDNNGEPGDIFATFANPPITASCIKYFWCTCTNDGDEHLAYSRSTPLVWDFDENKKVYFQANTTYYIVFEFVQHPALGLMKLTVPLSDIPENPFYGGSIGNGKFFKQDWDDNWTSDSSYALACWPYFYKEA